MDYTWFGWWPTTTWGWALSTLPIIVAVAFWLKNRMSK